MKSTLLTICSVLLFYAASSQSNYKNGVFLELGGSAYYYSFNYERYLSCGLTGRVGLAFFPGKNSVVILPLTIGKIYGSSKHHLEIAGGPTFVNYQYINNDIPRERRTSIAITCFFGYRYQKPDRKFFARAGFTPFCNVFNSDRMISPIIPWLGIGSGFRF
jgi:hypothetical protein